MGRTTTSLTQACGEPDAVKAARPVRESGMGKRNGPKTVTAPHADSHWADGGATALHNLVLLCDAHHSLAHAEDWQIRIIDGHPEFTPPRWLDPNRKPLRNTMHHPPDAEHAA
jgi:hypothetical protein